MSIYAATVFFLGFLLAGIVSAVIACLIPACQAMWRKRHNVLGSRVQAPEWRARRLTNGQWVVDRVRKS